MDKQTFWQLIDTSRKVAGGDPETQIYSLRDALCDLTPEEIVAFGEIFDEYHERAYNWGLWGAAYITGGGCSDDGFTDFRGWLVSRGEKVFEAALLNPETLAQAMKSHDGDGQIEGFQYLPFEAWGTVTRRDPEEFPSKASPGCPKEPTGESWEESEIYARFPLLAKKFK